MSNTTRNRFIRHHSKKYGYATARAWWANRVVGKKILEWFELNQVNVDYAITTSGQLAKLSYSPKLDD